MKSNSVTIKSKNPEIANGKVVVRDSKEREIDQISVNGDGSWSVSVKSSNFHLHYYTKEGIEIYVSKKYKLKVDDKKPKLSDIPSFTLNKKRGDIIWWKGNDNEKIKKYIVKFKNRTYKVTKSKIVIPAMVQPGFQKVVVTAYDDAGNKASENFSVWIW